MDKTRVVAVIVIGVIVLFCIVLSLAVRQTILGPGMYHCINDSDCAVVYGNVCGGAAAVNLQYVSEWNQKLEQERARVSSSIACKPTVPLTEFEVVCIKEICYAKQLRNAT